MADTMDERQRRKGGRGMETSHRDKVEIAMMAAAGDSKRAIARKTGRSRECIARVLKSEEVEELRQQARSVLDRAAPQLAENLITASTVGAAKGRFEGSFQALRALNVLSISDENQTPRTVVNIGQMVVGGGQDVSLPVLEWRDDVGRQDVAVVDTVPTKPTND